MLFFAMMKPIRSKRNHAAWVGPLVALIGLVTYFTVAVRFPALRDSAIVNLVLVIGGAAIAAWGLFRRRNWKSWIGLGVASSFSLLFCWYIFFYSSQLPSPDTAPAVGAAAPPLELPDLTGRLVSLDDFSGQRVLLVFYRGYW
jgi:drug/metabolite transporter (DMT)-like permease